MQLRNHKYVQRVFRMTSLWILLLSSWFNSCIKDKDYEYSQVYEQAQQSLDFSFSADSLPADGSSKSTITINVLPNDKKDSFNVSALNLSITTTNGSFVEGGGQSVSIIPTYQLDSLTQTRKLTAKVNLQSSTRSDTAILTLKYLATQQYKKIFFYRAFPSKIKISVSSLLVSPNFLKEDTITTQLNSATGLPSQGTAVDLKAYDSLYNKTLGTFRVSSNKTNSGGSCTFIYLLGDSVLNGVNYLGTIHLVAATNNVNMPVKDTFHIYSRN